MTWTLFIRNVLEKALMPLTAEAICVFITKNTFLSKSPQAVLCAKSFMKIIKMHLSATTCIRLAIMMLQSLLIIALIQNLPDFGFIYQIYASLHDQIRWLKNGNT
jgi:hypothetical protein